MISPHLKKIFTLYIFRETITDFDELTKINPTYILFREGTTSFGGFICISLLFLLITLLLTLSKLIYTCVESQTGC